MNAQVFEKVDKFFNKYKLQTYKKGEFLVRAGDPPSGIFYLKEGSVKQYVISKKGEEVVVNIFKPPAFFPMSWAINDSENDYYFEALGDLKLYRAPKNEVIDFIKSNSDVLFDLLGRIYRGVDGILRRMTYLMSGNANSRLITELIIYAKRFSEDDKEMIQIAITEKDLSAQTGLTRETISREIKNLKGKGIIITKGNKLYIKNLYDLEDEMLNF